jgi:hypothetical protein
LEKHAIHFATKSGDGANKLRILLPRPKSFPPMGGAELEYRWKLASCQYSKAKFVPAFVGTA